MSDRDPFWHFERAGWNRAASRYSACWSGLTRRFVGPLLDAAGVAAGTRLLDCACGPGYVSEAAETRGAIPIGIDFSVPMVRRARERNPRLEFMEGDAQELKFESGTFDAVAMNFGVPHLADPEAAFAEADRVLRPGGRFGFTVWASPQHNPGMKLMRESVEAYADLDVDLPEGPPSLRFSDPEECRRAAEKAGFATPTLAFETITVDWIVPTASHFFEAERDAGVRTAGLLACQSPACLDAIRTEVERRVRVYARDGGYAIPMAACVVAVSTPTETDE